MLSNTLANIPATALKGTLFVATDTFALYRYDGSTWQLIGGPGTGTITGSGTAGQLAYFNASSVLTSSSAFTVSGNRMTIQELSTNTDGFLNGVLFGAGGGNKNSNTRAGNGALQSGTAGATGYSVAVGFGALQASTIPSYIVAVGARALEKETGGSGNTAVGALAMFESSGSFWNTAMGYGALQNQTTGNLNVAIGYFAQEQSALNLNRNTSVGAYSLQWLASSGDNVGIGYNAGSMTANGNPNSSINQCVYIGANSKAVSGSGGNTNEIVIGYNASGNGSNSVTIGNNNILNTYLKGAVNVSTIVATKTSSGIAIDITDSANGNALNINKTGSGFAINVDAGKANFADEVSISVSAGIGASVGSGTIDPFGRANSKTFAVNSSGNSAIAINAATGAGRGALIDLGTNGVRTAEFISNINETTIGTLTDKPLKFNVNGNEAARFALGTKNFLINQTTDDLLNKLQVNGTVIASGYKTIKGQVTIAAGATETIYSTGTSSTEDGIYFVAARVDTGSNIYLATAIVSALPSQPNFLAINNLFTGANVALTVSGNSIRITNNGFGTLIWQWSILFQPIY